MKGLIGLRAKTYRYLKENNDMNEKAKRTNKCIIKRNLNFKIIKTV